MRSYSNSQRKMTEFLFRWTFYLELFQLCSQFVQPVSIVSELSLYGHGVSECGVGFIDLLHLHEAVASRGFLTNLE